MNNIKIEIKPFKALSLNELYEVLSLRNKVFVVEQNCPYLDIDALDKQADHVLIWNDKDLVAYARLFKPGICYDNAACIGRVLVDVPFRKFGMGHQLIKQCIAFINEEYKAANIEISAQEYLIAFYQQHSFVQTSDVYLEDAIPHVHMLRVNS